MSRNIFQKSDFKEARRVLCEVTSDTGVGEDHRAPETEPAGCEGATATQQRDKGLASKRERKKGFLKTVLPQTEMGVMREERRKTKRSEDTQT